MDSRFHGNDEVGPVPAGLSMAGDEPHGYNPLSPPLWTPAFAGVTN